MIRSRPAIQSRRPEREQCLSRAAAAGRTAIPPRVNPGAAARPALDSGQAGIAVDDRDGRCERNTKLLRRHLRDGDSQAGADVDLARSES